MNKIINIIKKTNGDILGVLLFLLLIIYFININNKTPFEFLLLFGSIIGLIVDLYITYNLV